MSYEVARKEIGDQFGDQTKPQNQQWVVVSMNKKPMSCEKEDKEKKVENGKIPKLHNKEDNIFLIVPVSIYGKALLTLIGSGASCCFISLKEVQTTQLQWEPQDTFLELGHGERTLLRDCVMDIPIMNGNHCTR